MIGMAVTIATAVNALKILFLEALRNQLNVNTNPLYNEIAQSTRNVVGKEVRKMAPYGLNGGFGAGTEDGELPASGGNQYIQFISTLKNLYGTIEISDKSIKASASNVGAFVQLLNDELKMLLKSSQFNLGRMLFGDGVGKLATCAANSATDVLTIDSTQYLMEGMTIDILNQSGQVISGGKGLRIEAVDRVQNKIRVSASVTTANTDFITVQNSYNLELTGLGAIFKTTGTLYGVDRSQYYWMIPYIKTAVGTISDVKIQSVIDYLEDIMGSKVNYIVTSPGVRRAYQNYLEGTKRLVNTMELKGGFTALSYNGIPLVKDRFVPAGEMFCLDTKQFTIHHMGDWEWLEEDGRILTKVPKYPIWTATLVRYAELICDHPGGQGKLTGITEDTAVSAV